MLATAAEQLTAWSSLASAIATVALVFVGFGSAVLAFRSIWSAQEENRKWNTLNVCAQHEFSGTVSAAVRALENAFAAADGVPNREACRRLRVDAYTVLNYLDGIAIGVNQGLYIEDLAKDHLRTIVHLKVHDLLETTFAQDAPLDKQDWNFLVGMAEKWRKNEPFYGTRGR
jgi:hypothetical protein